MSKYTNEIKITIINDILNNLISFNEASRKYHIDVSQIIDWYKQYENYGIEGLIHKNRKYSGRFKEDVIEYKKQNHMSLRDVAIKFKIPGRNTIKTWEKIYDERGPQALYEDQRGRRKKMNSKSSKNEKKLTDKEKLLKENEQLRMENEYLKKLNALVQERIKRESKKK